MEQRTLCKSKGRSISTPALVFLGVLLCGTLVDAQPSRLQGSAKDGPDYVAEGIRDNAKTIEHDVDGIKKAVDSVKLGMTSQHGPAAEASHGASADHDKLQGLATAQEKVQKMKAAVHAAAMIKQNAIQKDREARKQGTTSVETGKQEDDSGQRGRKKVITLHQPKWFAEGPYVIIALLVTIFFTFCYCACSSQPTSMSNKYDMR